MRAIHLMRGSDEIYGAERVIFAELIKLQERGVDVRFLMLQETRMGDKSDLMGRMVEDLGIEVIRVPVSLPISPGMVLRAARILRRLKPLVVHTHGYKGDFVGLLAGRLARVPVIGEVSGWLFPDNDYVIKFYEWLDAQTLKRMDVAIALAEYYKRMMVDMGFDPGMIRVLPSGVEPEELRARAGKADIRARLGLDEETPTVGMLTRLSEEKGVDLFIKAMARVIKGHPEARGIIFGTGPEEEELKRLARTLGLERNIIWAGYVEEAMDALLALDVLAQTSRIEALPQTLMEAMVMSRPVVTTAVGGCPELVGAGETGSVAPRGDADAVARGIIRLLDEPALALTMGQRGAERIQQEYTMDRWADRTIRLYEEMVRR